jgi:phosphatidylserine/phosphatidylglycerophosphate/cardiolipin synthase-like enzyme
MGPGKPPSTDQEATQMDASSYGTADTASVSESAPRRERLDRAVARTSDAPLREGNRLGLLKNGPSTYDDWLAAIGRAQRWVHLDNYIFQDDTTGKRFAEALSAKAAEGVRIRCSTTGSAAWTCRARSGKSSGKQA